MNNKTLVRTLSLLAPVMVALAITAAAGQRSSSSGVPPMWS